MDILKDVLKENKYVLVDYTSKLKIEPDVNELINKNNELIKNNNEQITEINNRKFEEIKLLNMMNLANIEKKSRQPSFKRVVFLIDLDILNNINRPLLACMLFEGLIPCIKNNYVYMYNKGNHIFFKKDSKIHPSVIKDFINKGKTNYLCNVCFEKSSDVYTCLICNFHTCNNCEQKILNSKCIQCKSPFLD